MFLLRDIPKYDCIRECAERYPDLDPASSAACLVMLRVASDMLRGIEDFLAERGLSQGRFTVLMLLNREPEMAMSPSDLAERSGVSRATMTGLLDGLERESLVTRRASSEDRRKQWVTLTARGRERLEGMLPDYFRGVAGAMSGLEEREKLQLLGLLERLHEGARGFKGQGNETPGRAIGAAPAGGTSGGRER